jgi:hypothetical protein
VAKSRENCGTGGKAGYLYNVTLDGDLIVDHSRDPECDLARILLSHGITGMVTIYDGNTGRPRTQVNVEKAAKLSSRDDSRLRFGKWKPRPSGAVDGHSPETGLPVPTMHPEANEAA